MTRRRPPPENPTGLYFARVHRELSQDQLSELTGVPKGQISKLERAGGPSARELTRAWAEKFEKALNIPAERIIFWDKLGPPDADDVRSEDVAAELAPPTSTRRVKLKGYVGAGAEAHYYALADEDFEEVEAPPGATDQTVAVEIKGTSMGPALDTWLVFYRDVRSPVEADLIGKLCVVGLADDRILIKTIRRDSRGRYSLISNDIRVPAIEDAQIEWAAKVTDMRPR